MTITNIIYLFTIVSLSVAYGTIKTEEAATVLSISLPIEMIDAIAVNDCTTSNACGIIIKDNNGSILEYALAPIERNRIVNIQYKNEVEQEVKDILSGRQKINLNENRKERKLPFSNFQMDTRKSFLGSINYQDVNAKPIEIQSETEYAIYAILKDYALTNWPGKTKMNIDSALYEYCHQNALHEDCQPDKDLIISSITLQIIELLSLRLENIKCPQKDTEGRPNCTDTQQPQPAIQP